MNEPVRSDTGARTVIYQESFESGPGVWVTGRDIENGSWHRNIFGHRGGPVPLGWSPIGGRSGGFAYAEPPWYFDDNHGQFAWLHLAFFVNRSSQAGLEGRDLRNAAVDLTLRGTKLELKGTTLYFWIQGESGLSHQKGIHWNWALTSQPIDSVLRDGQWHDICLRLAPDESRWSFMGLLNGGLAGKVLIHQSLSDGKGTLEGILGGGHVNFGFLLCGVDANDPPTGRFDLDSIRFTV
jgi:hypothetical protein